MDYELTFREKPEYLHAVVTGRNTRANVASYMEGVLRECLAKNRTRVLIEERLEGPRLQTVDVFQIASEGSSRAFGKLKSVAYVDVHAEGDLMRFAETVAVNRAMPVTLFATVAEAERWLVEQTRRAEPPARAAGDEPLAS